MRWVMVASLLLVQPAVPAEFKVRLDTTKGPIVIAVHRDWAPHGADRFHELVTSGYYDDAAIFRIRPGTWAQFGIAGNPTVAQAWRTKTIPDDPYTGHSNTRGTVAYAFKDPNGRTTQMFINLKDNSATHDLSLQRPSEARSSSSAKSSREWTSPTPGTRSTEKRPAEVFAPATRIRCSREGTRT
jgi:cyclophilin family peptidyl-prolyl cis-trans isomerase